MGMLFNTPATQEILRLLNNHFGVANIGNIRNTIGDYQNWPRGGGGTYAFLSGIGLTPSSTSGDSNWKAWLKLLDHHVNKKSKKGAGEVCAKTIGDAIAAALDPASGYQAIEFFAVPDAGADKHISVEMFDIYDAYNNKTLVLNVYTATYDKLSNTPQ